MIINGLNIIEQKAGNTCGYASAAMILNFLEGLNLSEDFLFQSNPFDIKGITFTKLIEVYNKHLKNHTAEIIHEDKEATLNIIKTSINKNLPLQILYLTQNKFDENKFVLHYSVLIGYDEEQQKVTIADPYGYLKEMSTDEFFEFISFRNDCLPDFIKKFVPSNSMIKFS